MHSVVERRPVVPSGVTPVTVQEEVPRMQREGGLHSARPHWCPPTKQLWATPGGLIAASLTSVSCREGVAQCLRTSPPLGGTLGVHRTSWRIAFPMHASGVVLVLGFRVAWVSHTPP